jgi:hypothetical protein
MILRQKIKNNPILGGGGALGAPPLDPPLLSVDKWYILASLSFLGCLIYIMLISG